MLSLRQLSELAAKESNIIGSGDMKTGWVRMRSGRALASAVVFARLELDHAMTADDIETWCTNQWEACGERKVWAQVVCAGSDIAKETSRLERERTEEDGDENDGSTKSTMKVLGDTVVQLAGRLVEIHKRGDDRRDYLEDVRANSWAAIERKMGEHAAEPRALELQAQLARTAAARDLASQMMSIVKEGVTAGARAGAMGDLLTPENLEAMGEELYNRAKSGKMSAEQYSALMRAVARFNQGAQEGAKSDGTGDESTSAT